MAKASFTGRLRLARGGRTVACFAYGIDGGEIMPMRGAICLVAAGLTACATVQTVKVHTVKVSQFSLSELAYEESQDVVWARALAEFQHQGWLIRTANTDARVLVSLDQPATVPCSTSSGECEAVVIHQFTLAGGKAVLRINRVISGSVYIGNGSELLTPEDKEGLQRETDNALSAIVTGRRLVQQTALDLKREQRMQEQRMQEERMSEARIRRSAVPPKHPWRAEESAKVWARCIQSGAASNQPGAVRAACDCASWKIQDQHTFDEWLQLDREQATAAIERWAWSECESKAEGM